LGNPPGNDAFANATALVDPTGFVSGNNLAATKEPGEPNHAGDPGGSSVWYSWQAPSGESFTFTTHGRSSPLNTFNTLLAVYTGTSVNSLTPIAGNNNDNETICEPTSSRITFTAVAGTTYYFAVDGVSGSGGNFGLRWGRSATISGPGLSGVIASLNGDACREATAGAFSFTNVPTGGSYSISGRRDAFESFMSYGASGSLSPLTGDVSGIRFVQTTPAFGVGGFVRTGDGNPIATVVTCTNTNGTLPDSPRSSTTASGNWSIGGLWVGSSYLCAPTNHAYIYNPTSITVFSSNPNILFTGTAPTAAVANISGQVVTAGGTAVSGATITLTGEHTVVRAISDSNGYFRIENLESGGFYSLIPARPNYLFNPSERSFSLLADKTDTVFTAEANGPNANPLDSAEFFVRQQYLDFLGREPEQGGLDYWSGQLRDCGADVDCLQRRRVEVSAAFFIEQEFQQTELFIYNLYQGGLGRQPEYGEYAHDREAVVAGAKLAAAKRAFAEEFVERPTYLQRYPRSLARAEYVDTLLSNLQQTSGVDLSSRRAALLTVSASGGSPDQSRSLVLRSVIEDEVFRQKEYNAAFVLMEYFGYMRRAPDAGGYEFWLAVLNGPQLNNYRGMVCAFITSAEYQQRFSPVITHANYECSQ